MPERARAGQPLYLSPFGKETVQNDGLDAIADYKRRALGGSTETIRGKKLTDIVQVLNYGEADQARGKVLQLGPLLLAELDNDQLWFTADVPAEPVHLRFCILREPVPAGEIGDAQVSGCCIAWVDVSDLGHAFAYPVSGETNLASGSFGLCEILSPLTETGAQECVVRIGLPRLLGRFQGILLEDFDAEDSTVTCDHVHPIDGGPSCLDDPDDEDEVVPVYNPTGHAGDMGNLLVFRYNHYTQQLETEDTRCPEVT